MNEHIPPNITRISDLPDSYNTRPPVPQSSPPDFIRTTPTVRPSRGGSSSEGENDLGLQNSYIPMNIHANPYGNSPPLGLSDEQKRMIDHTPNQRLPSRDIRIEPSQILQDEQTRVNYIPAADDLSNDFVLEYERNNANKLKQHDQEKHRVRLTDRVLTEIQTPLLMAVLFFLFQMPLLDRLFFKYFLFFNVFNADGHLNLYGMLAKSLLFGLFYYSVMTSIDMVSEL